MGKLQKAQDFLVAAYWNSVRKVGDKKKANEGTAASAESRNNQALRHRAFTKLFAKQVISTLVFRRLTFQGMIPKAIDELASAIYLESITYGPESPILVSAYYEMGILFLEKGSQGAHSQATRFFEKIVQIWLKNLRELATSEIRVENKKSFGKI